MVFIVYSKENCPLCDAAKKFLDSNKIEYQENMIGKNITREEVLAKFPEATMVPIIITESGTQLDNRIVTNWINQEKLKRSVN